MAIMGHRSLLPVLLLTTVAAGSSCDPSGTYHCIGQCLVNGTSFIHVDEPANTLRRKMGEDGVTPTPFWCNTVSTGDDPDFEEECGVPVNSTGTGPANPLRLEFVTVKDHRGSPSPPFVEDFLFAYPDCDSFTKIVRAPADSHMVCDILCTKKKKKKKKTATVEETEKKQDTTASSATDCHGSDPSVTKVLFTNERLRVLDFRLPVGSGVANVSNALPTVRWQILGADQPIPQPVFYAAGTCAAISNPAGEERRDFVFEMLGAAPRYSPEQVSKLLAAPKYTTDVGSRMFLENDWCRMWDFHSPVGMDVFHQHVFDYAFVVIGDGSALNLFHPSNASSASAPKNGSQYDATFSFHDGQVNWNGIEHGGFEPDGRTPDMPDALHSVDTRGFRTEFREYLIELK